MLSKSAILLFATVFLMLTSCASIVSKSKYPIEIKSTPSDAKIVITNKKGIEVFAGQTPATVTLKSGNGFFTKAEYYVQFSKPGYDTKKVPIYFKLDGWYFGNIMLGGVIGMLIVDPATGAMYKLDTEFLDETLTQSTANVQKEGLNIYTVNTIPEYWKGHLVSVE